MTELNTDSYPTQKGFQGQMCDLLKIGGDERILRFYWISRLIMSFHTYRQPILKG